MKRATIFSIASACAVVAALIGWHSYSHAAPEPLFLAMQIEQEGQVIARPQLLGETGRKLKLQMLDPVRPEQLKLSLDLLPERKGNDFRVKIKLRLPDMESEPSGVLSLAHGEERELKLDSAIRPLTVRLLVMKVHSSEFDSFMKQVKRQSRAAS